VSILAEGCVVALSPLAVAQVQLTGVPRSCADNGHGKRECRCGRVEFRFRLVFRLRVLMPSLETTCHRRSGKRTSLGAYLNPTGNTFHSKTVACSAQCGIRIRSPSFAISARTIEDRASRL